MLVRFIVKSAAHGAVSSLAALVVLTLAQSSVYGQGKCCPAPYQPPCPQVPAPGQPQVPMPEQPQQPAAQEPTLSPEAFAATGGGESFAASAAGVIGDGGVSGSGSAAVRASALKIAENQSPMPQNRFYFGYNYFNNVDKIQNPGSNGGTNVNRYTPGFERAFGDSRWSFGANIPVFGVDNNGALGIAGFGNMNLIGKYAFINDRSSGNVVSGGMNLTIPTGQGLQPTTGGTFRDAVLQPYGAYIYNPTRSWYVQGFSSVAVPTDMRDICIMFNDISTGYWVYRGNGSGTLNGVIPVFEVHVNTPLNHRGLGNNTGIGGIDDSVVLTEGVHLQLRRRGLLTLGVAEPVTGAKPFDIEAIAQFNFLY